MAKIDIGSVGYVDVAIFEVTFFVATAYGTYKIVKRATDVGFPYGVIRSWLDVGVVMSTLKTAISNRQIKRITWSDPVDTGELQREHIGGRFISFDTGVITVSEELLENA